MKTVLCPGRCAEVMRRRVREDVEYLGREQMGHFLAGIAAAGGVNVNFTSQNEHEPRERCLVSIVLGHGQ